MYLLPNVRLPTINMGPKSNVEELTAWKQLVKKFSALYGTRRFNAVLTRDRN
jgi:hypothetical protein